MPRRATAAAWRRLAALGASAVAIAVPAVALAACAGGSGAAAAHRSALPAGATVLRIGASPSGRAIPAGFVGLSLEYPALPAYAGTDPASVNPVLVQLIRNLNPGQAPVLRIGGDSTDWTWWPVPGMAQPAGVNYSLSRSSVAVLHALASTLGARLILGIDLEADSASVASAEARALVAGIPSDQIAGLELGNEPELYGVFTWDGSGRKGRAPGYDFPAFNRDVTRIGGALPAAPLAGPAIGAPHWFPDLGQFLSSHPRVAVSTLHRYPLQLCFVAPSQPNYPTIANLLSDRSSRVMANTVAAAVKVSHARGIPLRIDEMSTISCGTDDAVAKSFASALWALDALFQMARVGVDGVNIHSYPHATYELFTFSHTHGRWRAVVEPEYYGLELFAEAAPPGSRLLRVSASNAGKLKTWATRATDGSVRVVVINDGRGARTVAVRAPAAHADATLERLEAPRLTSRGGVTLGGQSFGATTGRLGGTRRAPSVAPKDGLYNFRVPAGSASLLTIPAG